MNLSDFKWLAAFCGGAGVCLCVASGAILIVWCAHRDPHDPQVSDDAVKGSAWLLGGAALCAALYSWGQS